MKAASIVVGNLVGGGDLRLDLPTLIDTRGLITGNSGAGKRLLRRIAEQAFGKVQVIIVDPEGEFATLREKHGFLLAGRAGEVQAEPRAAALLAKRLMELRVSAVLDLYDLRLQERRSFVKLFLEALVDLPKDLYAPVLVLLDEAHLFAPEGKDQAESRNAVIDLMTRGRKRGVCGILATQRISKLDKDAAAEAKNYFVGGITLDTDLKRAADILGLPGKADKLALRDIPPGRFLTFGPALSERGVLTFTSGDTFTTHPKSGQRHKLEPTATPEAIQKVAAELQDLPQQADEELRSLQAAKARVRELERQLKGVKNPTPEAYEAVRRALADAKARTVDRPVLKDAQVKRLEAQTDRVVRAVVSLQSVAHDLDARAQEIKAGLALAAARGGGGDAQRQPIAPRGPGLGTDPRPGTIAPRPAPAARKPSGGGDGAITGPEQKILDALMEMESFGIEKASRPQLGVWCAYTNHRSGGFTEPLGRLNEEGLVAYPDRGLVVLTDEGRARANVPDVVMSTTGLQERILRKLDGPQEKILKAVIAVYPNSVERDVLGESVGYKNHRSGGFTEPLGHLKTLGLVEYPGSGKVKACPVLFLEGA